MYDSTYTTDWDDLSRDEALERAYALGVAAACGDDNRQEYDAIKAVAASSYDRSLIELSFDQGRSDALQLEASGTESAEIWDELIETTAITVFDDGTVLPELLDSAELFDRFGQLDGPPATLSKPSFLLRDGEDNE